MTNKIFIDFNIWLYRLLYDPKYDPKSYDHKRKIAIKLTNYTNIIISIKQLKN